MDDHADHAADEKTETGAGDDVERVVGAHVDPAHAHAGDEQPRHEPPPAA
jgi:hypothetical protein